MSPSATANAVAHVPGRQQAGAHRPRRVEEVDGDRGRGTGDAVDPGIARVLDDPLPCGVQGGRHRDLGDHAGVECSDGEGRLILLGFDEASLQRERDDGSEHVSAVRHGVHEVAVGAQLREQEVQVGLPRRVAGHDADLAGQGRGAAESVDLARIRGPHHGQQHRVTLRAVGRQILGDEEGAPRGAPTHEQALDGGLTTHGTWAGCRL
jgi:hypothetical protein